MRRAAVLLALLFALASALLYSHYAWRQCTQGELAREYVSDEVWYVSAARNIGYLLGLKPRPCPGVCYTTLFYNDTITMLAYKPPNATPLYTATAALVEGCNITGNYSATATRCCYSYPDKRNIDRYLNLEHPPLAKYIIALEVHLLGDCPVYWRVAPLILSTLGIASAVYLAVLIAAGYRLNGGIVTGLTSLTLLYVLLGRSSFSAVSCFAILEPFTLGFGGLALVAAAHGRRWLAYVLAAASVASKYTGLVYLGSIILWDRARWGTSVKRLVAGLILALATMLVMYAPLAVRLGPAKLVKETLGGLEWFMTSRPPGPAANNPLDWLTGGPSFALSVKPRILASPNPVVMSVGLAASIILLLAAFAEPRAALLGGVEPLFLLIMTLVYLAGNHTLYSFYVAVAEPFAATSIMCVVGLLYSGVLPKLLSESYARLRASPEARVFRLLSTRGALTASVISLAALGAWGTGSGVFRVNLSSHLDYVLVFSSVLALSLTSLLWRRLDPLIVAAAFLASGGVLPGAALIMLAMGLGEARWLIVAAPLIYPRLSSLPLAAGRRSIVLASLAAYIAARLVGLAPGIGPLDAAVATVASLYAAIADTPPASVYALLAFWDPGASLVAAALEAARGSGLTPIIYAAAYAAPSPARYALLVLGLLWSLEVDARRLAESLRLLVVGVESSESSGGDAGDYDGVNG